MARNYHITSGSIILYFVFLALLASCRNEQPETRAIKPADMKEPLIFANKEAVSAEKEQINDYLRRHKWDMNETGSGLLYWIYKPGVGEVVEQGDIVELKYTVSLLTGDTVYTSEERGNLLFSAGKAQVISGLEEGILLLRQGERAKFIIPSHLAYGLIGDQERIGKKATLIYDVEVLEIKKETNIK